ncbi:MAG: Sec-independent protein translocase protein TatB [Pseudomonadota bacterium]
MFGVDFSEMMVIMVVALLVIGPERLPKVARTLGHLWGRAQRYINGVKADISRDMAIDEFRRLQQKVQQEVSGVEQTVNQAKQAMNEQVQQLNNDVARPVGELVRGAAAVSPSAVADSAEAEAAPQQVQLDLHPQAEQKKFPID